MTDDELDITEVQPTDEPQPTDELQPEEELQPGPATVFDAAPSLLVRAAGALSSTASGAYRAVAETAAGAGRAIGNAAESAGGAIKRRFTSETDEEVAAAIAEEAADFTIEQSGDTTEFGREFIRKVLRLKVVRIDRAQFLTSELRKQGISEEQIELAVSDRPAAAGIPDAVIEKVVKDAISVETRIASATSFAAGIPGGVAMAATIPTDLLQYYVHVFRLVQKIAYAYGWQSFLDDAADVDDETLLELSAFLGVAIGVETATSTLTHFAVEVAEPAIAKKIAAQALTKTAWYNPLKSMMRAVGVSVTKTSFARTASKVVPVVSGFVCGGMTFAGLSGVGKRLAGHLETLPQARPDMLSRAAEIVVEVPAVDDGSDDDALVSDDADLPDGPRE